MAPNDITATSGASTVTAHVGARSLAEARPLYFLPNDPLAEEVLIPGFQAADKVDCMVGFFSSQVLTSLAPGLASFISGTKNSFRLIISPILRPEDQRAIECGIKSSDDVTRELLDELVVTEDSLQQHTLKCFSWLLRVGRIEIKIALMEDALFHPKVWLFQAKDGVIAAHGSSNVTHAGIRKNIEQVAVSKSWEDPNQRYITEKLSHQFERLWGNQEDSCIVVTLPHAIRDRLIKNYQSDAAPTESDLRALYIRASKADQEMPLDVLLPPPRISFHIPTTLRFDEGPFEHQGRAVRAWCEAGYQGVLEMATGSGKTITAMLCAHSLYSVRKPLLIVIAAPYVPLIQQWCDEVRPFGLLPINLTLATGSRGRANEINRIRRSFHSGSSDVEVMITSHRVLCDHAFQSEIAKFECTRLLIGDEVHNLGSDGFAGHPPTCFDNKLGLSATPVRQYDDDGTAALFSYFGQVVFRFTLAEAIGRCLVGYDYFVHPVELTHDEMDQWRDLTATINENAWRKGDTKAEEYLMKLLRDRRAILENAENKIRALKRELDKHELSKLRHTLIYASDKAPEQLVAVNSLLNASGVLFHQLTDQETSNRGEVARIIAAFKDGHLQVLTAKRVLDEGVNIPQICKAFILASTTVERQWVQRRGRLLRMCPEIGKTHSEIHDFIALPPDLEHVDHEARSVIQSELLRVQEFARLARNAGRADGPLSLIHQLVQVAFI
jgi:superfamily II DNA or RNA helicase